MGDPKNYKYKTFRKYNQGYKMTLTVNLTTGYYYVTIENEAGDIVKQSAGSGYSSKKIDYNFVSQEFARFLDEA